MRYTRCTLYILCSRKNHRNITIIVICVDFVFVCSFRSIVFYSIILSATMVGRKDIDPTKQRFLVHHNSAICRRANGQMQITFLWSCKLIRQCQPNITIVLVVIGQHRLCHIGGHFTYHFFAEDGLGGLFCITSTERYSQAQQRTKNKRYNFFFLIHSYLYKWTIISRYLHLSYFFILY